MSAFTNSVKILKKLDGTITKSLRIYKVYVLVCVFVSEYKIEEDVALKRMKL